MNRPRTDHLTPWQPGDPVGRGQAYLPNKKVREQYHGQCQREIIHARARMICAVPDVHTRRAIIARYPEKWRDLLKARVKEIWEAGR